MEQFFVGASYTAGPFTHRRQHLLGHLRRHRRASPSTPPPAPSRRPPTARQGQRRYAYSVGANYRLAPGLDLVAEWVRHVIHERGVDLDVQTNNGVQDKLRANVFLVGTRLAF